MNDVYCDRRWLNKKNSSSTGSFVAYDGPSPWDKKRPVPIIKLVLFVILLPLDYIFRLLQQIFRCHFASPSSLISSLLPTAQTGLCGAVGHCSSGSRNKYAMCWFSFHRLLYKFIQQSFLPPIRIFYTYN